MPEIVVNGRFLARPQTGIERYGTNLLKQMENDYQIIEPDRPLNGVLGHMWEQFAVPMNLSASSVLWSPANTGPIFVRNQVISIHDLSPLEHPEWFRFGFAAWYWAFWPLLIRRVRRILVPSEHVKRRLIARFGPRPISVIHEGVDTTWFRPDAAKPAFPLPSRYVLFVGSIEPRKNLNGLLKAWNSIKRDYKGTWLLIAGSPQSVFARVRLTPDLERVRFLGYVPESDLPGLYAGAALFVLPSFDEGFGLPVLEAMACRTPILASDGGALPEIVGNAGIVFHLADPCGLTDSLRRYLGDPDLRRDMSEAGLERARAFTWRRAAQHVSKELHAS